ncbi:RHS repeat-associated core domain-containing protein, partial [Ravibacter arvi]|uniref:RHS repeat-associated core domain-containing protein n=1 Tax=Ravibacter arvi TaxID=2051041 RepID=UPI0031EB4765
WLRKVEGKTSAATNFGVELRYASASEAQHNGNIGEMLWLKDGAWNGYRLKYDGVNRLTEALNTDAANGIWEKVTEYDKNGNLKKLQRGKAGETWDNLEYLLSDNRLTSINDAGNANGVKNGSSAYAYDDGGNLTSDGNKGATIAYNRLNLPRSVSIGGKTLGYSYDGNGTKLRMANGAVNTKYAGLFEYDESNYLTRITTEEGQIAVTGNGNTYTPNYYLKDHLGNVRAVINKEGTILQETEYFPFGLAVPRTGTDAVNKYQYNGKEKQPETGYLDYGARMYDPSIARWMVVDPLAELMPSWSPYNYTFNNPIKYIDRDGTIPDIVIQGANNSSVTVTTDLVNLTVNASSLGVDFGGNYTLGGRDVLQAAVDIGGVFDPTPTLDIIGATMSAESGDYWGAGASVLGAAVPVIGDVAKTGKIVKGVETITEAIKTADNAKALLKQGRAGKPERLAELATDTKLGKADKGWIKSEMNQIERGNRKTIRNPPGKDLAHERGREAAKGYSYKNSHLQDRDLHRRQHKYDDKGRKNRERPLD